uniref:Phospholipase n=1 Tax=Yoonia rhodophyticola TaxID=3137370 RepID=A0AAN0MEP7_9RHOB
MVEITGNGAVAPVDPFATGVNIVDALQGFAGSIAPTPLFGLENLTPPPTPPVTIPEILQSYISESQPRQGPRLPTQARFETLIVTGIDSGNADGTLDWDATVTGGRWAGETRSVLHRDGNPGNPAASDVHAPGVRVRGDLGLDVARHAARRAQPILPIAETAPGWIVFQGGNNFNRPSVLPAGADTSPDAGAGALLKTVAAICETPELGVTSFPVTTEPVIAQDAYNALLQAIATAFGLANPPALGFEGQNEDRLGSEIVKEIYTARHGARDALWALRRAIGEAREFIYIESPQFARTAIPESMGADPPDHAIDLVAVLAARMNDMPSLRVAICLPRASDFAPSYRGWVRQAIEARTEAVNILTAVDRDRVAVFHPKGFPGRAAHLRTTSVIVDDCWALVGTSHFRRRGMTFDGAADIVSIPYDLADARSQNLATYRQALMAQKLGLDQTRAADRMTAQWARLWDMRAAFTTIKDLLDQGGAGVIAPLWAGPTDTAVEAATANMADPDGSDGSTFETVFPALIGELGD